MSLKVPTSGIGSTVSKVQALRTWRSKVLLSGSRAVTATLTRIQVELIISFQVELSPSYKYPGPPSSAQTADGVSEALRACPAHAGAASGTCASWVGFGATIPTQ